MKTASNDKETRTGVLASMAAGAAVVVLLLCGLFFFAGKSSGVKTGEANSVDRQVVQTLASQKQAADSDYQKLKTDTAAVKKELADNQAILDELNAYKANKQTLDAEIAGKTNELNTLNGNVAQQQAELTRLTGAVQAAKSEKILTAGRYIVGTDVEPGKYDIELVSGSGNFFARGSKSINEIFGTNTIYSHIREYKNAVFAKGDEIELRGNLKVKLLLK